MVVFKQKRPIGGENLGERLKKLRLEQKKTLEEVGAQTKIPVKYLEILEKGEHSRLPGNIYARAWIREYTHFLGVASDDFLAEYKIEKQISENIGRIDKLDNRGRGPRDNFLLRPRSIKLLIITVIIGAVFAYLLWELTSIIASPLVHIAQPPNNFVTLDSQIKIIGQTVSEAELIINGERVLTDNEGHFEQTVNLVSGLNKFKISAKKKHSRTHYLEWNVLRQ